MLSEAKNIVTLNVDFNWVLTRFILFEIERGNFTFPIEEIYKLDKLIIFHEKLENYEICSKIIQYKNII